MSALGSAAGTSLQTTLERPTGTSNDLGSNSQSKLDICGIPFLPSLVCHGSGAWIDDLLDTKELLS